MYQVFQSYDLEPAGRSYADIAADLEIPVTQVTNYLHSARRRFKELVLQDLRALTDGEDEYRANVRELLGVDA